MRFVLGAFRVMGGILRSAFKNDNVYNIVLPREPIPYETLGEPVEDKFAIYTRTGSLLVVVDFER